MHRLNARYWEAETQSQTTTGEIAADYVPGSEIEDDQDNTFGSRFLYAFWRLCDQRIATITTTRTPTAARKTGRKPRPPADVRIVTLRRPASPATGPGQPGHEWHHQWVVRMHKVNQ